MRRTIPGVLLLTLGLATSALAQRDTMFSWSKKLPDGARFSIRNLNGFGVITGSYRTGRQYDEREIRLGVRFGF